MQNGVSRDLLENAIDPEYSGCIRALGCSPSQIFGKSSSSQIEIGLLKNEIKIMKEERAREKEEHAREMAELREQQRKFMDEILSHFMPSG